MTHRYTLRDAKARLSALLDQAAAGETIAITGRGARAGRFRLIAREVDGALRRPGALSGRIALADDLAAEDPAVTAAFEGRPPAPAP